MASRFEWTGIGPLVLVGAAAVALTVWQVQVDRSAFDRYFGSVNPIGAMLGTVIVGTAAMARLHRSSEFAVVGPRPSGEAVVVVVWAVPLLAAVAIGADLALRYGEDTNLTGFDGLRFYPAMAVFVEMALHVVPVAVIVGIVGMPAGIDQSFWRLAVPVAAVEAVLQAVYAESLGTALFSAAHLMVFGVAQVWMFWRFGFVWMLGFRLAYYLLWHLAWGSVRLRVLF